MKKLLNVVSLIVVLGLGFTSMKMVQASTSEKSLLQEAIKTAEEATRQTECVSLPCVGQLLNGIDAVREEYAEKQEALASLKQAIAIAAHDYSTEHARQYLRRATLRLEVASRAMDAKLVGLALIALFGLILLKVVVIGSRVVYKRFGVKIPKQPLTYPVMYMVFTIGYILAASNRDGAQPQHYMVVMLLSAAVTAGVFIRAAYLSSKGRRAVSG